LWSLVFIIIVVCSLQYVHTDMARGNLCMLNAISKGDGAPISVTGATPFLGNAPEYAAGAAPSGVAPYVPPAGMGATSDYAAGAIPDGAPPNANPATPTAPAGMGAAAA
jgi:hypothetical protein